MPLRLAPSLYLAAVLLLSTATGCFTSTSRAYSFRPAIGDDVPRQYPFKIKEITVLDSSLMGLEGSKGDLPEDKRRAASVMADRIRLRFDPKFIDLESGLDMRVEYIEEILPRRFFPDMVPYGFPLNFPLFKAVLPVVETTRHEVKGRVEFLDHHLESVFHEEFRLTSWRKDQTGLLLGAIFVMILPVRGEFTHRSPLARHYRHEAMSRMILNRLAEPAAAQSLADAYQRNKRSVAESKKPAAVAVPAPTTTP